MEPITAYLIKKISDAAIKNSRDFLDKRGKKLKISDIDFQKKLSQHLKYVCTWSGDIKFKELKEYKETNKVYVNLDYFLFPRNTRDISNAEKINLKNIFDKNDRHLIILGQPGAGKTTTMKFLCQKIIFDEKFYPDKFNFPILIRLRDIDKNDNPENLIFNRLFQILGFDLHDSNGITNDYAYSFIKECVLKIADELKLLIILDGFDEIPSTKQKELVIKELTDLSLNIYTSRIIITSRTSDFEYNIENMLDYEISPLSNNQIKEFTYKYIDNRENSKDLYQKILSSPFSDTAMRPLTLAHLCALYENYGDIPEKPKAIYRKTVYLLVENWDAQRSIERTGDYPNFPVERKLDFLYNFAYLLTTWKSKSIFDDHDLKETYSKLRVKFNLPENKSYEIIRDLESHSGLFIQSGFNQYEFSHKSIQEYLTAEYIIRLGFIPNKLPLFQNMPNEFAIAVAISSEQTTYLANFIFNYLPINDFGSNFINIFLNRLMLEKPDFEINDIFMLSFATLTDYCKIDPYILADLNTKYNIKNIIKNSIFKYYYESGLGSGKSYLRLNLSMPHDIFKLKPELEIPKHILS